MVIRSEGKAVNSFLFASKFFLHEMLDAKVLG